MSRLSLSCSVAYNSIFFINIVLWICTSTNAQKENKVFRWNESVSSMLNSFEVDWSSLDSRKSQSFGNKSFFASARLVRQDAPSATADVERQNVSVVLEGMQLERSKEDFLMYCNSGDPFSPNCPSSNSVRPYDKISWNWDGRGSGACGSGGNGRHPRGRLIPLHYHINITQSIDFDASSARLDGLQLSSFKHINTVSNSSKWDTLGEAGDTRMYVNGTFNLTEGSEVLLSATSVKWYQNWTYPLPIGSVASEDGSHLAAYFVGRIVEYGSNEQWVDAIDPFGTGYLLGVVRAASFGPAECYSTASFWVTLRGFPDLGEGTYNSIVVQNNTADVGAKVGPYAGSNETNLQRAKGLAKNSVDVVSTTMTVIAVGTVAITAVSVVAPAAAMISFGMPGGGATRMIRNAQFVAKLNEIRGFHTDSFREYGGRVNIFLAKFRFPFKNSDDKKKSSIRGRNTELENSWSTLGRNQNLHVVPQRQGPDSNVTDDGENNEETGNEEGGDPSVTDEIFKGCAFYTMLMVLLVLLIHAIIWVFTRHRPTSAQVAPHAWMVYIFSLVMEYVHTSSVLNAAQYFRSHVGNGTGQPVLYLVAFLQLTIIGFGFLAFFMVVIVLANRRLRVRNVNWIPKTTHPDPEVRKSTLVSGEYQAEDDNFFHGVFEGYYSGLAGPRIWLAVFEILIGFVDTIVTAVIWNEIAVLSVLVGLYAVLFLLFLSLGPFVDTIEGRLVLAIGLVDLILLVLELLSTLGNYDTADKVDNIAIILATVSVVIGALITFYCDVIPISLTVWEWMREWVMRGFRKIGLVVPVANETFSEWSALSKTDEDLEKGSEKKRSRQISSEQVAAKGKGDEESSEEEERFRLAFGIRTTLWRRKRAKPWEAPVDDEETTGIESGRDREIVRDDESSAEPPNWWQQEGRVENIWNLNAANAGNSSSNSGGSSLDDTNSNSN